MAQGCAHEGWVFFAAFRAFSGLYNSHGEMSTRQPAFDRNNPSGLDNPR